MTPDEDACARCGRLTPLDHLRVWTTRERLREFTRRSAPAPARVRVLAEGAPASPEGPEPPPVRQPAVAYRWITRAHALCPGCFDAVSADGRRFHDHDRRRAVVIALAFLALAVLIWTGFAPFTANWIAAFWRNGAGGR